MNTHCRDIRPLLSAYMDNELTPEELRSVQAHVAACPECAAIMREYRQIRSAVRGLSQPLPPPELRAAVFAKATPAYRRRATVVALGQRGLSYTALVAATIAIFFTLSLLLRSGIGPSLGAPDTTPPQIIDVQPSPNTPSWELSSPIRITFSEQMNRDSVLAALTITTDPPLSDDERQRLLRTVSWDENTLVIGGGGALQPYTDYTITIDPRMVRDLADNGLREGNTATTFRTVDVIAAPPTPTAVVALASAVPQPADRGTPTATAQPSPSAAPSAAGSATPTPTVSGPVIVAAPSSAPSSVPAPVTPTATTAPPSAAPVPTATPIAPTATPQPTEVIAPTSTPTPSPSPTARPTETSTPVPSPTPTATPAKSPFAVGQRFAPLYDGNAALAERIGSPTANEAAIAGSYLAFERGWMLWRGDTNTIYVMFNEDPLVWYAFADGWSEGMPPGGGPAEKAGLFKPMRGFGKVWTDNADVQRRLGYAIAADEMGGTIAVQPFERGLLLASDLGASYIYVFYQNNLLERIKR